MSLSYFEIRVEIFSATMFLINDFRLGLDMFRKKKWKIPKRCHSSDSSRKHTEKRDKKSFKWQKCEVFQWQIQKSHNRTVVYFFFNRRNKRRHERFVLTLPLKIIVKRSTVKNKIINHAQLLRVCQFPELRVYCFKCSHQNSRPTKQK